ncbi:hypothetical protein D3C76_984990 [compost metagenome]
MPYCSLICRNERSSTLPLAPTRLRSWYTLAIFDCEARSCSSPFSLPIISATLAAISDSSSWPCGAPRSFCGTSVSSWPTGLYSRSEKNTDSMTASRTTDSVTATSVHFICRTLPSTTS